MLARGEDGELYVAYVPADAPGLEVIDDWDGMGQRTTASGTVRLEQVPVPRDRVVPHHLTFLGPQLHGAQAQLMHAAIDVGIAGAALAEAVLFVREKSRPWFEAEVERAAEDPLLIQRFGELSLRLRGAEALLRQAAETVDRALSELTEESTAEASIAVASAKVAADGAAVELSKRAVRGLRHALGAELAQPAPALAQRAHAHAARPGSLEAPAHRPLCAQRNTTPSSRPALRR